MTSSIASDVALRLDDVRVRYWMPSYGGTSFKEYLIGRVRRQTNRPGSFEALRGVTFEIRRGEMFGVIGGNGAGKSTLLRTASGILPPTSGRVRFRGRLNALLDMSPGFHPELTGRENVFLNGAMLGYRRAELEEQFAEIVAFSEIGDFLSAPLRTYSSGMMLRLAFSIATCRRPDVLVVDEVLAVGDAHFLKKCFHRIQGFRSRGTTIMLVSHGIDQVAGLCDRVLWLDHGVVREIGPAAEVVEHYREAMA